MKFGVNYTPRSGWFHSWLDFDPAKVADDFAAIASLGVDHVRIFPLWPLLQPNRTLIRPAALADLATTADLAGQAGLDVSIDVLQGHLSSFDFLPSWVSTWHRRNIFTDDDVVAAETQLVREIVRAVRGLPNVTGITLGNEFPQFAAHRHPEYHDLTPDQAHAWLARLLGAAEEEMPGGMHVHSHDDDIWFDTTHPFEPSAAVLHGAVTTVHSWIFGAVGPRFGEGAPQLEWFARYLCELAAGYSPDPARRVWLQEVGAPENYVPRSQAPDFLTGTIDRLLGGHGGGVSTNLDAITWWCSHDIASDLADFPYFEHSLGLIDEHGRVKDVGEAYASAITRWGSTTATGTETADGVVNNPRPVMDVDVTPETRDLLSARGQFFDRWFDAAISGEVPRIRVHLNNERRG